MGLVIVASVLYDNCNGAQTPNTPLVSVDAPLPDNWLRVQGYANTSNGASVPVDGYFCPICATSQGSRALVKKAADITTELTAGS